MHDSFTVWKILAWVFTCSNTLVHDSFTVWKILMVEYLLIQTLSCMTILLFEKYLWLSIYLLKHSRAWQVQTHQLYTHTNKAQSTFLNFFTVLQLQTLNLMKHGKCSKGKKSRNLLLRRRIENPRGLRGGGGRDRHRSGPGTLKILSSLLPIIAVWPSPAPPGGRYPN